ncbi:uncharacterized protein si:dkeyp-117h8.4 isoform X2 [Entelurus aequoreus]|uniref:uncharacterized protein si:dkeyp-117h8.4 isoform X2 n=1 Tax=Entelurus aequoreus TaxID=161455 RepID=UPI002B1CFA97|nr:uncharacterized protein si:dkeyp-117h8.4 isoform X2 [Entelurus aequoreus]
MDLNFKDGLHANIFIYKKALDRIVDKYSKIQCQAAIDLDLAVTSKKALGRFMAVSEKEIAMLTAKSQSCSTEDRLELHEASRISRLELMQQNGGGSDESHIIDQLSADDEESVRSYLTMSLLDDSQRKLSEIDSLPEDQDEELEMSLSSGGSRLSELYPAMIDQIGRARHREHVSKVAEGVVRRYRKWRLTSKNRRGTTANDSARRSVDAREKNNQASWQRPVVTEPRQTPVAVLDPSYLESPKAKRNLNKTFIVGEQPPSRSLSPPRFFDMSIRSKMLTLSATESIHGTHLFAPKSIHGTHLFAPKSIHGTHLSAPKSIHGTHFFAPESIHGTHLSAPKSILGTHLSAPESIHGTHLSIPKSIHGTHLSTPESIHGTHLSAPKSILGTHLSTPKSIHGTHFFAPESIHGTHLSTPKSIHGTHLFSPESIHGTHLSTPKSIHGTHLFSPESILGTHLSTPKSIHGTHFFAPESIHGTHLSTPKSIHGTHLFSPESIHGTHLSTPKSIHGTHLCAPESIQGTHLSSPESIHGPHLSAPESIHGSPLRQSPLKTRLKSFSRSPQTSSRSAAPLPKPPVPQKMLHPEPRPKVPYSPKELDKEFLRFYHKLVCQNKPHDRPPCRLCARSSEAARQHSSQTLVALALSPHRLVRRKRHRERDWENESQAKRWSAYSPGSKRHSHQALRRRLCMSDDEASNRSSAEPSRFGSPRKISNYTNYFQRF